MRLRSLLFLIIIVTPIFGKSEKLLAPDWRSRLHAYQFRLLGFCNESIASGQVSYPGLIRAIYPKAFPASELALAGLPRPSLNISYGEFVRVVVDPQAASHGLRGYVVRARGQIFIAPPGTRHGFAPVRQAIAFAHEVTHTAQHLSPSYPEWLGEWLAQLRVACPDHPGVYLLSHEEMEVRLAEFRRMVSLLAASPEITPETTRKWLSAFGVHGIADQRGKQASGAALTKIEVDELSMAFPDFFELLELVKVDLRGRPERRRQELIDLWAALVPHLR